MFTTAALMQFGLAIVVLGLLISGGLLGWHYLKRSKMGEASGLFTPRFRRLSFIERAALDGGRKLLLIRRDDVEHLVMIGGPIDIVIETGIARPTHANSVGNGVFHGHEPYPSQFSEPSSQSYRQEPPSLRQAYYAGNENGPAMSAATLRGEKEQPLELSPSEEAKPN